MSEDAIWRLGLVADDDVSIRVLIAWYRGARDAEDIAPVVRSTERLVTEAIDRLTLAGLLLEGDPPEHAVLLMTAHTKRLLGMAGAKGKKP